MGTELEYRIQQEKLNLCLLESTDQFRQEFQQAYQRLQSALEILNHRTVGRTYFHTAGFRINDDGYLHVWFHDATPLGVRATTADAAAHYALAGGAFGTWTIDEVEQFVDGKGPIFEEAMRRLGYRKHTKDSTKWCRFRSAKEESEFSQERMQEYNKKERDRWNVISDEESARLTDLLVLPNVILPDGPVDWNSPKTYSLMVVSRRLICVDLDGLGWRSLNEEQLAPGEKIITERAFINKEQNGFCIDAKNILLGNQKALYLRAVTPGAYVECVWPTKVRPAQIYTLADDLVSKVTQLSNR